MSMPERIKSTGTYKNLRANVYSNMVYDDRGHPKVETTKMPVDRYAETKCDVSLKCDSLWSLKKKKGSMIHAAT